MTTKPSYISDIRPMHCTNSTYLLYLLCECIHLLCVSHLLNKFKHISNTLEIPSVTFSTPPFYLSWLCVLLQKTVFILIAHLEIKHQLIPKELWIISNAFVHNEGLCVCMSVNSCVQVHINPPYTHPKYNIVRFLLVSTARGGIGPLRQHGGGRTHPHANLN